MRMALLWFLLAFANAAFAKAPYEMKEVILLQPDFVLQERIAAPELARYIAAANDAAAEVFAGKSQKPAGGFLVLAVRPGKQSAAWLDIRPALPPALAAALLSRLRAIPVPAVQTGPVVFALRASLWGGAPPAGNRPVVDAWNKVVDKAGQPLEVGDLVECAWPR